MTALTMSDVHGMVTSGEWSFARFFCEMPHLMISEAFEQYNAIMESGR